MGGRQDVESRWGILVQSQSPEATGGVLGGRLHPHSTATVTATRATARWHWHRHCYRAVGAAPDPTLTCPPCNLGLHH